MASAPQGQQDVGKTHGKRKRKQQKQRQPKQNQKIAQKPIDPKRVTKDQRPIIVPRVAEPHPACILCGKPIESIAQAIGGSVLGSFCHFDCVLRQIAETEHVLPSQKVSYIGRGTFAIIETLPDGKFQIVKRIAYETPEIFSEMKKFVENQKH